MIIPARRNKWTCMTTEIFTSFTATSPVLEHLLNKWVEWGWCYYALFFITLTYFPLGYLLWSLNWPCTYYIFTVVGLKQDFLSIKFVCLCAGVITNISWVALISKVETNHLILPWNIIMNSATDLNEWFY